jgi:hypothetical protein
MTRPIPHVLDAADACIQARLDAAHLGEIAGRMMGPACGGIRAEYRAALARLVKAAEVTERHLKGEPCLRS